MTPKLALVLAGTALLASAAIGNGQPRPDPDWPCVQRKVPTISAGAVWSGPDPAGAGDIWASGERRASLLLKGLSPGAYSVATLRLDDAQAARSIWDKWRRLSPRAAASRHRVSPSSTLSLRLASRRVPSYPSRRRSGRRRSPGRGRLRDDLPPSERENILLTWTPGAHVGMQTFGVLSARSPGASFERVNPSPLLSAASLHAREPGACRYVIEAKNLDGSRRTLSDPIEA